MWIFKPQLNTCYTCCLLAFKDILSILKTADSDITLSIKIDLIQGGTVLQKEVAGKFSEVREVSPNLSMIGKQRPARKWNHCSGCFSCLLLWGLMAISVCSEVLTICPTDNLLIKNLCTGSTWPMLMRY